MILSQHVDYVGGFPIDVNRLIGVIGKVIRLEQLQRGNPTQEAAELPGGVGPEDHLLGQAKLPSGSRPLM